MLLDNNSKGFALVAALLGNLILLAVGILAINLSTGDLRGSMHAVQRISYMTARQVWR
jgi:hypothetical protein